MCLPLEGWVTFHVSSCKPRSGNCLVKLRDHVPSRDYTRKSCCSVITWWHQIGALLTRCGPDRGHQCEKRDVEWVRVRVRAVLREPVRVLFEKVPKSTRAYFFTVGAFRGLFQATFALVAAILHHQTEPSETGPIKNFCASGTASA